MPELPILRFEDHPSVRYFPRPIVKSAVLVTIPKNFSTFIQPEWDPSGTNPQVTLGDYYAIIGQSGKSRYLSERRAWELMHHRLNLPPRLHTLPAMFWVKTAIPDGFRVPYDCTVTTAVPGQLLRESSTEVTKDTLCIRQRPLHEVQFVRRENEHMTYFTPQEAEELGLTAMSDQEFAAWAVKMAERELALLAGT